jgi:transposase-like protein
MTTREATKGYRLTKWASILQARKESGLRIRDYCRDAEIPEHQYYYWQRELRKAACENIESSRSSISNLTPPGFMEVKLPLQQSALSPTSNEHSQLFLEAPGVKITAGGEYPVDKLIALLREVMQPC